MALIQSLIVFRWPTKNYVNALILDSEEDYQQKTLTFTGLAEVMQQNRIGIASSLRMPMTKLFGLSASGFNTGESDLENYNQMVESEVRARIKPGVRQMIRIACGVLFGYVPRFTVEFPSLRVLTALQEEEVKNAKYNRLTGFYDRALMDSEEAMQEAQKGDIITTETAAARGEIDGFPAPPNDGQFTISSEDL